jgi:hypothetical protein
MPATRSVPSVSLRFWTEAVGLSPAIDSVSVEITQARPEGEKLGAEKGINLPETRIDIPALTPDDLEALKFIVQHADLVGYSFVRTASDVRQLIERLEELGGQHLGLILKIETRKSFDNLPKLILAAMCARSFEITPRRDAFFAITGSLRTFPSSFRASYVISLGQPVTNNTALPINWNATIV